MSSPKRFRFTNQLIKSLPPNTSDSRSTDAEYSDTEISGLKCLVSKGEGRKKFLLRYLYHGRKRAIAIGHWPEVDVNLARQIAIEHKRSLATGTDPKQERENKRMELTFDELFNQHYLPWAKSAKRSWGKDVQRYRDHIRPAIGQRLLSDITPASILRLQQTLSTSLSAATCNRVIVLIKAVFTWAGRQSMTSVHPARVVQLLRENNARQRYFTEDEIYFHEIALYKVSTPAFQENPEASKLIRRYNARIVEVNPVFSIVEKNGMSEDITSLYGELKALNCVLQFVRSGRVAITTSCFERVNEFLDGREAMYNQSKNQQE